VGRDGSPVLDHYPPKASPFGTAPSSARAVVKSRAPAASPPSVPPTPTVSAPPGGTAGGLLRLDSPFDPDEFARQLGETRIQVDVPRDSLAEVLRRVADFMGFGIYVYEIRVAPVPGDQLQAFRLELTRVDYSAREKRWNPFEERGRSDSPFGPGSTGTQRT
jgi:hypothetical protein